MIDEHHILQNLDKEKYHQARATLLDEFKYSEADREMWRMALQIEQRAGQWEAFNALADEYLCVWDPTDTDVAIFRIFGYLEVGDLRGFRRERAAFRRKYRWQPKLWALLYIAGCTLVLARAAGMTSGRIKPDAEVDRRNIITPENLHDLNHRYLTKEAEREAEAQARAEARCQADAQIVHVHENFEEIAVEMHDLLTPAIFLNPSPAGEESAPPPPCYFGGKPRMPADMAWPKRGSYDLHFLAQFDCASLPRELTVGGMTFSLPEFPETGTLYLFFPLDNNSAWDIDGMVLYRPETATGLPERDPPETLMRLNTYNNEDRYIEAEVEDGALQPCGQLLWRQEIVPVAYLSARGENPLRRNMERESDDYDTRRDMLDLVDMVSLTRAKGQGPQKIPQHNFGFAFGMPPFQMFGQGYVVQSAADDYADHVMMMQVGSCHGLPLSLGGYTGIFQFWIKPEDLKANRFDTIFATREMT